MGWGKITLFVLALGASTSYAQSGFTRADLDSADKLEITCEAVDHFAVGDLDAKDELFGVLKSSWTKAMVARATKESVNCYRQLVQQLQIQRKLTEDLRQSIDQRREKASALLRKIGREIDDREAAVQKSLEQERLKQEVLARKDAEAQRLALEQCKSTSTYHLYEVEQNIVLSLEQQRMLSKDIAKDGRVRRVSGVRDLYQERMNGETKVQIEDDLKQYWTEYKKLGGKAANPRQVKLSEEDPCDSLRRKQNF